MEDQQPKITIEGQPVEKGKGEDKPEPKVEKPKADKPKADKPEGRTPKVTRNLGTPATRRLGDDVKASPGMRRVGGAPAGAASPSTRRQNLEAQQGRATPGMRRLVVEETGAVGRSPGMSRAGGAVPAASGTPGLSRLQAQQAAAPVAKKKFFSDVPLEEELTPYESWTTGELAPVHQGLDVGLRARAARETGPGGTGTGIRGPGTGAGAAAPAAVAGGVAYLGPDVVPGETREEREMRQFLARGEGTIATKQLLQDPVTRRTVLEGTVQRPGSVRPGSFRPGSVRPEGAVPAGPTGSATPGPVRPGGLAPPAGAAGAPGTPGQLRPPGTPGQLRAPGTPGQIRVPGTPGVLRPVGGVDGDLRREMFRNTAGTDRPAGDIGQQFDGQSVPLVEKQPAVAPGGQLSPYEAWDNKLQPEAGGYYIPPAPPRPDPIALAAADPRRADLFQGVSARARTTVYQFIWELKLRCFTEGEILEQELRKEPDDRVYLKLIQPQSLDQLGKTKVDSPVMRFFKFFDGTMPEFSHFCRRNFFLSFIDAYFRGAGQVMMCNNPIGGAIAIGAMFAATPWVACMACFGLLCSTTTALILGVNRAAWQGGLFGYNGLLLGAACGALMLNPWEPLTIPIVFVGATFTSLMNLAFGNILAPVFGAPPLALAFVFCTWIVLGAMYGWQNFKLDPVAMVPHLPGPTPGPVTFNANNAFQAWLRGLGAIYFAGTTWSGVMMFVGMLFFSRISAIMMVCGSIVGLFDAWMAGVDVNQIYSGGYSYDAALAAIGVGGLFFVISWKVSILAMMAAWFASWLHSALTQWLAPAGLPALNLGFDITVILFVMIQFSLSGIAVIPLAKISQPEAHYYKTRTLAATLRALAAIEEMKAEQRLEREELLMEDLMYEEATRQNEVVDEENATGDVQYQKVGGEKDKEYDSDDLSL